MPGRETTIQKVPKYGMKDPSMLYQISCPYKVHVYYVLLVCRKISRCESWPWSPSVNLYIVELRVLFGGHETIEVQC
jgi:hypothetical protein